MSAERLITQFEMTTSTESAGQRDRLDRALQEMRRSDSRPLRRSAGRARASRRSCRARRRFRVGPTRFAERITSIPPPEPRSRTTSPSRRSATAVGLPQPERRERGCIGQSRPAGRRCTAPHRSRLRSPRSRRRRRRSPLDPVTDGPRGLGVALADLLAQQRRRIGAHATTSGMRMSPASCSSASSLSEK